MKCVRSYPALLVCSNQELSRCVHLHCPYLASLRILQPCFQSCRVPTQSCLAKRKSSDNMQFALRAWPEDRSSIENASRDALQVFSLFARQSMTARKVGGELLALQANAAAAVTL